MVLFLGFSIHRNCRSDAEGWTADLENYKYEIPRKNPGNVLEKVSGKVQITQSKKKSIKNEWEISRSCMLLGVMRICLYQDSNADFNIKNKSQRLDQSTATGAVIGQHESEGIVNKKPTSRLCERFLRQQSFCSDLKVGNWISQSIFRV